MDFSHSRNGSNTTKLMLVAGLHVALGTLFVHSLGSSQKTENKAR